MRLFLFLIILNVLNFSLLVKVPEKVIIDVDVGPDDYLAILLLLEAEKSEDVKIEAIFCSAGNANLTDTCTNLMRLLTVVDRLDIPVYKGVKESIVSPNVTLDYFYGEDGFADLEYTDEPDLSLISPIPSPQALIDFVSKYPNEINLIYVCPLTNIAQAIQLYDGLVDELKDIWIMGGNYGENVPEFNVMADADASNILLEAVTKPVHMLTWQASVKAGISLDWRFDVLGNSTDALELLTRAEAKSYAGSTVWLPCDANAVFAFLNPQKNILETETVRLKVELNGTDRGTLVVSDEDKDPNVIVIEAIDVELFKDACLDVKNLK